MQDQKDLQIKFGGQLSEIDVKTLIDSLNSLTTVVEEINKDLHPENSIKIVVKATEKGSFIMELGLIVDYVKNLLDPDDLGVASEVLKVLLQILQIKQILKGKEPKSIEKKDEHNVVIESQEGKRVVVQTNVFHIYGNNNTVQVGLSEMFKTLNQDDNITDFSIGEDEERVVTERQDFDELSKVTEIKKEKTKVIVEVADLNIFKLVFADKYKWEFYYKGNKVSAYVQDPAFFEMINNGKAFSKGDILTVELEIHQVFDDSVNTYINDEFKIKKVLKHHPRAQQDNLNL